MTKTHGPIAPTRKRGENLVRTTRRSGAWRGKEKKRDEVSTDRNRHKEFSTKTRLKRSLTERKR